MPARNRRLLWTLSLGGSAAALVCLATGGCVPAPRPAPAPTPTATPAPSPTPAPRPVVTPTPIPTFSNWRDAPQTPGDWRYQATAEGSAAHFGAPQSGASLSLLCQRASRTIQLVRAGTASGTVPITIRTTNGDSAVTGQAQAGGVPGVTAAIAATDPLLDAIAFSRGRFAVEAAGLPTLYVPAWPEIIRVIDDCR